MKDTLQQAYMEGSRSEGFIAGVSAEEGRGLKWSDHYDTFKTIFSINNQENSSISFLVIILANQGD